MYELEMNPRDEWDEWDDEGEMIDLTQLNEWDEEPDYLPMMLEAKPKKRRRVFNPKAEAEEGAGSETLLLLALVGFGLAWWNKNKTGQWFWQRLGIGIGRQALLPMRQALPMRLTPQQSLSSAATVIPLHRATSPMDETISLLVP